MNQPHINKLRSRGHWRVVIRPANFIKERIPEILDLQPILEKVAVSLRGWDFPHIDHKSSPKIGDDWVEQAIDWERYVEFWRMYQSGQFLHLDGFKEDWAEQTVVLGGGTEWKAGSALTVVGTIFRFTEIFELASRLSVTAAGDQSMHISITLNGLKDRQLWSEDIMTRLGQSNSVATIDSFPFEQQCTQSELTAGAWELALKPALDLFQRFGWKVGIDTLRELQAQLRR